MLDESPGLDQIGRCGHIAIDGMNERLHKCGIHNTDEHCLKDCRSFKFTNAGKRIQIEGLSELFNTPTQSYA